MNLFRAATTGVDPQTGSYLSKQQRVAMFRESIGSSGANSGVNSSGFVQPQSGIAVRNNMAEVVEKLQVNTFQAIENVDAKVDVNKKDIGALVVATQDGPGGAPPESTPKGGGYAQAQSSLVSTAGVDIIQQLQTNYEEGIEQVIVRVDQNSEGLEDLSGVYSTDSRNEAQSEKLDTRSLLKDRQRTLRALREKLVEGIGSAVGKIQSGLQNIGSKVSNLAGSFLQRLGKFIALFGLAWLVDNYATLSAKFSELGISFESLKAGFLAGIGNVKGVWSLIDLVLRKIWKLTSGLVKTLYNVAKWVVKGVANLASKVFGALGNILRKAKNLISPPAKAVPDAAKAVSETPGAAKAAIGGADGAAKAIPPKPKNFLQRAGDAIGSTVKSIGNSLNPLRSADEKAASAAKKDNWLKRALQPLVDKFPGINIGKTLGILKRVPILGIGIDVAINRGLEGENWVQSIVSGILSGSAGFIGGAAGAKAGGIAGAALGSIVPGFGTAIGSVLGAAVGGLLGAYLAGMGGEKLGDTIAEAGGFATDKSAKGVTTPPGSVPAEKATPKVTIPSKLTEGLSTPTGMGLPSSEAGGNVTNVDLGTEVIDATQPKQEAAPRDMKNYGEVNPVPTIMSSDPETDFYRTLSTTVYDLAF